MGEKIYIGTKIIVAEPMTEHQFRDSKRKDLRRDEDRPGYKVRYEDGYVSWSPKEAFELAYREVTPREQAFFTCGDGSNKGR